MTGNRRRLLAVGAAVGSTLALMAVVPAFAGPNGTGGGPTAEKILGSGSDTTQNLMMNLDGLYMVSDGCSKFNSTIKPLDFSCIAPDPASTVRSENYEHDQVQEADNLGSSTGISQLCTQGNAGTAYIDFARSSRASKAGDCTGLHFVAYARDGISLEANSDGTAASGIFGMNNTTGTGLCTGLGFCLTQANVQDIYKNCTVTNWSAVGGQNLTIQIYTPQSGSGTRSQFETFVGTTNSTLCITAAGQDANAHQVPENQNTGISSVDKTTFIFPFSYAIYHVEVNNGGGYAIAAIDGIAPTATTIGNATFPYNRLVYNVICTTNAATSCGDPAAGRHVATQQTVDFVGEEGWICKPSVLENAAWVGAGTPAVSANASQPHHVSAHFNVNWLKLIQNKIVAQGFATLALGAIGGGDLHSDHCRLSTT